MQRTMIEVHKQLGHHHACLANSREVLMERLSHLWEQPKGREQCQAHDAGKDDKLSLSLGRARRARDCQKQFVEQTDTHTRHSSNSATGQEVIEPLSGTTGNSKRARREDGPANDAMISPTPSKLCQQTHQEVRCHRADAQHVARQAQERVQAKKLLLYKDFWKTKREKNQLKAKANCANREKNKRLADIQASI